MSTGHFCLPNGRMDEWSTSECRMDISVRPLVEWTYECPMDISVRPMVEWTFVYVQWTLLIFNTKYDNAGNAFCLLKAIMNYRDEEPMLRCVCM